jgi:hypothetical protein
MKRVIVFVAALAMIISAGWSQESQQTQEQAQQPQKVQPPQQPQETKYTNDSVARMSYVEGKTFIQRASDLGYEEGVLNTPVTEGDRLGTADGRMEVHFGRGNYVRLDNETKLDILNLPKKGDDIARMRVWSGSIYVVVGNLAKEKGIELHTADASFYILDKGIYRVNVRENRDTEVLVFRGLIEAAGEGGSTLVKAEQRLEVSEGRLSGKPSSFMAVADDAFDRFNQSRNTRLEQQFAKAKKNLPTELEDYESELDENGRWTYLAPYGNVWVPNGVDEDWRPYYDGRWVWLGLSGWTWLPYEPWGWSTFHYGRWHWGLGLGWYWIPTSIWGPAWVDWWWDDFYYGWGPMSYWGWGYPGFYFGFNFLGGFYGGYYGGWYGRYYPPYGRYPYYPAGGRALTVVRRNQLKDPHVSSVAVKDSSTLKSLSKMSFSAHAPNVRPSGTKISVQPLSGNRIMLRKDGSSGSLVPDRSVGRDSLGRPSGQGTGATSVKREGGSQGKDSSSPSVGKSSGSTKSSSARSSGSSKSSGSGARRIRKKDSEPASSQYNLTGGARSSYPAASGTVARSAEPRSIRTYPSSATIHRPANYGDGGAARSRSFLGRTTGRSTSGGNYGSSRTVRSGSSSSGRASSAGRISSSRGSSSGSRGSSGSRSSGGGVRRR